MEQNPTPNSDGPAIPLGRKLALDILDKALAEQGEAYAAIERLPPFDCGVSDLWIEHMERLSAALANVEAALAGLRAALQDEQTAESQGQNEEQKP